MGFLSGKRLLITGLLSNRSIAYGIARACYREGAELAFSYVGERFRDRITEFAREFGSELVYDCDVGDDAQIERLFNDLGQVWPEFDGFVHAVAFAPREAIAGDFLEGLSREGFRVAHEISAYSFPALAKAAAPRLRPGAALLTLSYLGAERIVPNYNTMGLARRAGQCDLRRPDPHAGGIGDQGLRQAARHRRALGAPQAKRHDRRRRQCRSVPAVRPRGRGDRRGDLRRRRLQPGRDRAGGRHSGLSDTTAEPAGRHCRLDMVHPMGRHYPSPQIRPLAGGMSDGGQCRVRTCDPCRVKAVLYR